MSIIDRMRVAMLEAEARTGNLARQVIIGRAEAEELEFLGIDTSAAVMFCVPVFVDRAYANELFVITNKDDMR